jgi:hypothetical protein
MTSTLRGNKLVIRPWNSGRETIAGAPSNTFMNSTIFFFSQLFNPKREIEDSRFPSHRHTGYGQDPIFQRS